MIFNNRYELESSNDNMEMEKSSILLARDRISNKRVVIKKRTYQGLGFSTEKDILRLLQHENLPVLMDCYIDNEEEVIVLLYFEGRTLFEYASHEALIEEEVIQLFIQLSCVVDYLHTHPKGIIHRDITPSNVLINERGHLLLIDFNVSTCDVFFNTNGETYGTIDYAAPETLLHTEMSGRLGDIYGIGACLQSILKMNQSIYSLELQLIVKKAMALNPNDRYRNIKQLKEDLQILV